MMSLAVFRMFFFSYALFHVREKGEREREIQSKPEKMLFRSTLMRILLNVRMHCPYCRVVSIVDEIQEQKKLQASTSCRDKFYCFCSFSRDSRWDDNGERERAPHENDNDTMRSIQWKLNGLLCCGAREWGRKSNTEFMNQ